MTEKRQKQAFFGGVPTDVDIKTLREAYPESEMEAGVVIPYSEVEQLLQEKKWSNRFKGVTNRWRKMVEGETGKVVGTQPGVGFKVLEETEKVDLSGSKLRTAARMAKRSYTVASRVLAGKLSEEDRNRLDFYTTKSSKVIAASQIRSRKNLLPDLEAK
jgi:hypothetical protein